VSPADAGAKLLKLAQEISESNEATLGKETVTLPDQVWMRVRLDRPPHGALVLKFDLEWSDGVAASSSMAIEEL
jgi:hypothetical protein